LGMHLAQEYLEKSSARLSTANHILTITYPTLHSPKLFLSAIEHLFLAMDYAMNAVLVNSKITAFNSSFPSRYSTFRLKLASKLGFHKAGVEQLNYLRTILLEHQKSPIEFERNQSLVICSDEYKMTILSEESVSEFLRIASDFTTAAKISIEESLSTSITSNQIL
jgi:hypothetical protein